MGKFGHQMVILYLNAKLPSLATAESCAKYVSNLLTNLCYVYKNPAATVSRPWVSIHMTHSLLDWAWRVLFRTDSRSIFQAPSKNNNNRTR